jgi:hypothetical protein
VRRFFAWLFQSARTSGRNSPAINLQGGGTIDIRYGETSEDAERRSRRQIAAIESLREDIAREKGVDPKLLAPIFVHLGQSG